MSRERLNHSFLSLGYTPTEECPFIATPPRLSELGERATRFLQVHRPRIPYVGFATSGSSGSAPKIVLFLQSALEYSAQSVNQALGVLRGDIWCCALPPYHMGGHMVYLRAQLSGGSVVPYLDRWNAQGFTQFLADKTMHWISLVPTQVADLVQAECRAPQGLKAIIVGGGGLSDNIGQRALKLGWPIIQSYGSTESASQIATALVNPHHFSSQNIPVLPHWETRILEDTGNGIAEGLLQIKGKALFSGYLYQDDQHEFRLEEREGEWWTLNDIVRLSPDGKNLTFIRRADRVVKVLGELVDLDALECEWQNNFGEGYILPLPDERRGYHLVLCSSLESRYLNEKVKEWNQSHIGLHRLHHFESLTIPKNDMGKLDRLSLLKIVSQ